MEGVQADLNRGNQALSEETSQAAGKAALERGGSAMGKPDLV